MDAALEQVRKERDVLDAERDMALAQVKSLAATARDCLAKDAEIAGLREALDTVASLSDRKEIGARDVYPFRLDRIRDFARAALEMSGGVKP